MTISDFMWEEALNAVRAGREVASPNYGFQKQLQQFGNHSVKEVRADNFIIKVVILLVPSLAHELISMSLREREWLQLWPTQRYVLLATVKEIYTCLY